MELIMSSRTELIMSSNVMELVMSSNSSNNVLESKVACYVDKCFCSRFNTQRLIAVQIPSINEVLDQHIRDVKTWEANISTYGEDKHNKAYLQHALHALETFRIIDKACFKELFNAVTLNTEEITEEIYDEMLDILPPLHFACNSFIMCEFYFSSYTSQFYKKDGKYYRSTINYEDRSTWKA